MNNSGETNETFLSKLTEFEKLDNWQGACEVLKNEKNLIDHSVFYYNQGFCHYKNGELVLARENLLKAKKMGFDSYRLEKIEKDIVKNLNIEYLEESEKIEVIKKNIAILDIEYFIIAALFFSITTFLLLKKNLNVKKILLILILFFLPVLIKDLFFSNLKQFMAMDTIKVHSGPSDIFEPSYEIPRGTELYLSFKNEDNKWIQVFYPSKVRGWIKKEGNPIKEIK